MVKKTNKLSHNKPWRGGEFIKLAVLIKAGLAIEQALQKLQQQGADVPIGAIKKVSAGSSLAQSLFQFRLINRYQLEVLSIAEHAGKLSEALTDIAQQQERQSLRLRRLKSQLFLPIAVFVLAMLISALLRLVGGDDSVVSVLWDIGFNAVVVYLMTKLLFYLLVCDAQLWLNWAWRLRLLKSVAIAGAYFEYYWYQLLLWQLHSGVDFSHALTMLKNLYPATAYQQSIQQALQMASEGQAMTTTLQQSGLVFSQRLTQLMLTAERAGSLSSALMHYLTLQTPSLENTADEIYRWLPRVYYVLILLMILPSLSVLPK